MKLEYNTYDIALNFLFYFYFLYAAFFPFSHIVGVAECSFFILCAYSGPMLFREVADWLDDMVSVYMLPLSFPMLYVYAFVYGCTYSSVWRALALRGN